MRKYGSFDNFIKIDDKHLEESYIDGTIQS